MQAGRHIGTHAEADRQAGIQIARQPDGKGRLIDYRIIIILALYLLGPQSCNCVPDSQRVHGGG